MSSSPAPSPPTPTTLVVKADETAENVQYSFTADGILPLTGVDGGAEADSDEVTQNADGTDTLNGIIGLGAADMYYILGGVAEFQPRTGPLTLFANGQQVTPDQLIAADFRGLCETAGGGDGDGATDRPRLRFPEDRRARVGIATVGGAIAAAILT